MLKFIRHESQDLYRAIAKPMFLYLMVMGNAVMLLSTTLFYYLEKATNPNINSFLDCLWWGVSTFTSVGYGDIVPVTNAGKCVGIFLMYTGTILFVLITGFLLSAWTTQSMERKIQEIEHRLGLGVQSIRNVDEHLDRIECDIRGKPK